MPVLSVRVSVTPGDVALDVLCAGFELKAWRGEALADDLFERHLLSFALTFSEYESVSGATALRSIKDAAISVYTTDKYGKRGEFGEILLHGALVDFYSAEPAVSKIYYEDSSNDVVKGFDSVHIAGTNIDDMKIWLGEAKFYDDLNGAVHAALRDIVAHLDSGFLRNEFMFISRKVDAHWPHAKKFVDLISRARSLDEISTSIVMPIFVTYDSSAVAAHDVVSAAYIADLEAEALKGVMTFEQNLKKPLDVEFRLIFVPIENKASLVSTLHKKLKALHDL